MPTVHLIDASPYIFRAYYSLPPSIATPAGAPANATLGFTEFLIQVIQQEHPTHLAAAFDGSLTTSFRNESYPAYKANRALPPPDLEAQMDSCREIAEAMGLCTFVDDRFEADDIVGTLAARLMAQGRQIVVISNDKDFAQLVGPNLEFWDFARKTRYTCEVVEAKFGVRPEQLVDLLALSGDSVDNIPGVRGIGPQTAARLLQAFRTLDNLYDNLEAIPELSIRGARAVQAKLSAQKETAFLSRNLATIVTDGPFQPDLQRMQFEGATAAALEPLCERLGFDRIKARIPKGLGYEK